LNLGQNKITCLPVAPVQSPTAKGCYNCPVLEELFIQDNQLTTLPNDVFYLPSLMILDISNNKLQEMPFDMWRAPKLRELNIAFNLLKVRLENHNNTKTNLLTMQNVSHLKTH